MQVTRVRLQDYRNISLADLPFSGLTQALAGQNAQGKTNLLEAIGLLSALRSFRIQDSSSLLRQGKPEARLIFNLQDERWGDTEVSLTLKRNGKEVEVDGEKVIRFRDFIGRFPVVVLSSQDIQLLRGSPGVRRQWLNLVLSSADRSYYDGLRNFHKVLQERNSLLKKRVSKPEMAVFEKMLAEQSVLLCRKRTEGVEALQSHLASIYNRIAPGEEKPELRYKPDIAADSMDRFLQVWEKNRARDEIMKSTQQGPHRDDLLVRLENRGARDFASEGQQRSMIISLKIAQLRYLSQTSGIQPVLLADDVLGELDSERKTRFWKAVGDTVQVIATGTEVPDTSARGPAQVFEVRDGGFLPRRGHS